MARFVVSALVLLPVISLALAAGCVGDDPQQVVVVTPDASTSGTDAAPPADAPSGADGGATCTVGTADCDNDPAHTCETDTRGSAANCGACARACGGTATCEQSECTTERLRDGLDHPFALELAGKRMVWYEGVDAIRGCRSDDCSASTAILADVTAPTVSPLNVSGSPRQIVVDGTKFYFSQCPGTTNSDCRVASCDVTGCKNTGATFVAPANSNRRPPVVVGGPGAVYTHQGLDGAIRTNLAAGTETAVGGMYKIGDILGAMHVDAQNFIYVDDNASQANPTGGVYLCPIGGCPGAPTLLLPPPVRLVAFASGTVFSTTGGGAASTGSILSCPVAGCGGAGAVLAQKQAFTTDIVADAKAVYWTTAGVADVKTNSAAVGTVMRCTLPSCAGGPVKIADQLTNPVSVRIDDTYVTWMTYGTPGNKDGAVYRKRR